MSLDATPKDAGYQPAAGSHPAPHRLRGARYAGGDGDVAENYFGGLALQGVQGGHQFQEIGAAEFERVFLGLILGAGWVIDERRGGLLDVAAEDVGHGARRGELD